MKSMRKRPFFIIYSLRIVSTIFNYYITRFSMEYGENVPDVIETLTDIFIEATTDLMIKRSSYVSTLSL